MEQKPVMPNLTKRTVDAATPGSKNKFIWDQRLKGFGLLVSPSGIKSFVVQYRNGSGRSRRLTLGRFGELTPNQARKMASDALALVRARKDPLADRQALKAAATVSEMLDRYIAEHVRVHNGVRMQHDAERLVGKIIRPRLGPLKVEAVTRDDISKLHRSLVHTPRQGNLALSVLSKAFNLAEVWGMRPEYSNPVRKVKRYKENERERFLSGDELARLGSALEEAGTIGLPWIIKATGETEKHMPTDAEKRRTLVNPIVLNAIRLLLFTGARLSEILELRWDHVDMQQGTIALPARKGNGRRPHPVSSGALAILSNISRTENSPFVFPRSSDPQRHISQEVTQKSWRRIRTRAGLQDVRLHDLRHTVGTFASQAGSNAFMISHLLRHSNVTITNRYVNPDADPIRELSETIGRRIEAGLSRKAEKSNVIYLWRDD